MGNRRLATARLEKVMEKLLSNSKLNGLQSSPFSIKDPDRYYLEEYFVQRPALNAAIVIDPDANDAGALAEFVVANRNFELKGDTGASADDVTFASNHAGLVFDPDAVDNRQLCVLPHTDTNQTAWNNIGFGTENQVQWECTMRTGASIADACIFTGLKLTGTPVIATDNDGIYFLYDSSDDSGTLTTNTTWHVVYNIDGTDYITDTQLTVAADTNYRFCITIDSNRKASVWINNNQYSLAKVASSTGGTKVTPAKGRIKSLALKDDINLLPMWGIVNRSATARSHILSNMKISRILFE